MTKSLNYLHLRAFRVLINVRLAESRIICLANELNSNCYFSLPPVEALCETSLPNLMEIVRTLPGEDFVARDLSTVFGDLWNRSGEKKKKKMCWPRVFERVTTGTTYLNPRNQEEQKAAASTFFTLAQAARAFKLSRKTRTSALIERFSRVRCCERQEARGESRWIESVIVRIYGSFFGTWQRHRILLILPLSLFSSLSKLRYTALYPH